MKCPICKQRSAKRNCPGIRDYICPQCCGREREVSIDCPFECPYLQESYRYEMGQRQRAPRELAYENHGEITDEFLRQHEPLVATLAVALLEGAGGLVDADLRAILDALVRTYETMSSGLIYETLPEGLHRVGVYQEARRKIDEWRQKMAEQTGMSSVRDADVLRVAVFLGRVAQDHDHGRPRGKAFIAFLRHAFPDVAAAQQPASLIVPGV